jgi:hypothetical protein
MPVGTLASKHTSTVQKTTKHANTLIHKAWSKLYSPYPQALAQTLVATPGLAERARHPVLQVSSLTSSVLLDLGT